MNIHRCCTLRNLILAAVLTIGFASSALAQERALFVDLNSKEATDLGTLGGNVNATAYGINDAGQVVGLLRLLTTGRPMPSSRALMARA